MILRQIVPKNIDLRVHRHPYTITCHKSNAFHKSKSYKKTGTYLHTDTSKTPKGVSFLLQAEQDQHPSCIVHMGETSWSSSIADCST
jgi:hypothetical protein